MIMARLYFAIVYMCWQYGEVVGLLPLCDMLGMDYKHAWRSLSLLAGRDANIRITRDGKGKPLRIMYQFKIGDIPSVTQNPNITQKTPIAITFPPDLLYRV
jgi:hypothetical protein